MNTMSLLYGAQPPPVARYEQTARKCEDTIRRLREKAPSYERIGTIERLIDELAREVNRVEPSLHYRRR